MKKFFLCAALTAFLASSISFAKEAVSYLEADREYAEIKSSIVIADDTEDSEESVSAVVDAEPVVVSEETVVEAEEAPAEEMVVEEVVEIDYPSMNIDFEELLGMNSDFVAVIYIPALDLYYPVVQGEDNQEYLHKTFEGTQNAAGSVFMDYRANSELNDGNTFIFAHNMKSQTMFGSLKRFLYEDGLCASDPYIYLYTEHTVYKYHVFSYSVVGDRDDLYFTNTNEDAGYDSFVKAAQERSQYSGDQVEDDFSSRPNLLTLSTCFGAAGGSDRFVVQSVLVGTAEY